jgi:transcriptional regulator with XRE-family HTH domain
VGDSFGARLRAARIAAGLSLGELAFRTKFAKSYLSKIENDLKPPTRAVARQCDAILETGGGLSAMIPSGPRPVPGTMLTDDGVWVMTLDESGDLRFHQLDRRQLLAGAGALLGFAVRRGTHSATDEPTLSRLRSAFDHVRQLGMMVSPSVVLGQVIAQLHTVRALAHGEADPARAHLLLLASRLAEYAGWMSQEAGRDDAALWWTRQAVDLAAAGGNRHLASYALVRRAEIELYKQDAIATIELARQAQASMDAGPRILGLAARCEAQGHALAVDAFAFRRALDRATELLARPDPEHAAGPVLGSSSVADQVALTEGWSLYDLGRPAEAAELLDRHVAGIAPTAHRARARFGARRALAHAENGEIDHACLLARDVLEAAARVDSATVRMDLRQLKQTLARWHGHGAVRELLPELTKALHT